jgi:hypothetical protein
MRDLTKESVADYRGGDLSDKLSALIALAVGRRLRSGGITRCGYGDDKRGTPPSSSTVGLRSSRRSVEPCCRASPRDSS